MQESRSELVAFAIAVAALLVIFALVLHPIHVPYKFLVPGMSPVPLSPLGFYAAPTLCWILFGWCFVEWFDHWVIGY